MFHLSRRIAPQFTRRLARLLVVPLVVLAFGLRPPLAANAAGSIVVDSLGDKQAPDGHCTLREAIIAANTNAPVDTCAAGGMGEDVITFSVSGTIILGTNLPRIPLDYSGSVQRLIIRGPGVDRLTISGNNRASILLVNGWLSLENATIANGNAQDGGAVFNSGLLTITNSSFSDNRASGQSGCEYRKDLGEYICSYHGGGA